MNLGYFLIAGIFFNFILGGIFPNELLDTDTANKVMQGQEIGYDFSGSGLFDENLKNSTSAFYEDVRNQESTSELIATTNSTFTNVFSDTPVTYFDSIVDSMKKVKTIVSMVIPFAAMFFLLPGIIGVLIGSLYSGGLIYAIIKLIRGI